MSAEKTDRKYNEKRSGKSNEYRTGTDRNTRVSRTDRRNANTSAPKKGYAGDKPRTARPADRKYHNNSKYQHDIVPEKPQETAGSNPQTEENSGIVIGRNAVRELLRGERTVDKLLVRRGDREGSIVVLVAEAVAKGIPVIEVDKEKLDAIAGFTPHQGVIAMTAEKEYVEVEDILAIARERGEDPLLVIADEITDPYNLGAIIRCAEGLGAHGLIIPKRRSTGLTPLVSKASAGAIEHLAIAKVVNLAQTVAKLQEAGVWVYAAEAGGQNYSDTDFSGPCALILGSEGNGVSALLKEKSDAVVSIPLLGHVNSLNVSTAAAILLAEASRQHIKKRAEAAGK